MGGQGSGRLPSTETIIKRLTPEVTPVGTSIFLPNYSGIKDFARKDSNNNVTTDDIYLPDTNHLNPHGIVYKSGSAFIHNFSYGYNGTITPVGKNIFIGKSCGNFTMGSSTTNTIHSSCNVVIGYESMQSNTSGWGNISVGTSNLYANTTGIENVAVGLNNLYANTTGWGNVAIGKDSLYSNTTGYKNTAVGLTALNANTTGNGNFAFGADALITNKTGSGNIAIGYEAGGYHNGGDWQNSGSSNCTYIGASTYSLADGETNTIVIGNGSVSYGSNTCVLGNSSIVKTILRGAVCISGALWVSGSATITGNLTANHSTLSNLDYASAGHTGFEPTVTKGNLTTSGSNITVYTGTGAVIGSGTKIGLTSGNLTASGSYVNIYDGTGSVLGAGTKISVTGLEPTLTKGNLTASGANVTVYNGTGAVIGSGTQISVSAGAAGEAFPVGSVFISVVSEDPSTLLGYGTWEAFGTGRFLVGINGSDADFDTVEEVSGSKTVAITSNQMPRHSHTGTTATENAHTHGIPIGTSAGTNALKCQFARDTYDVPTDAGSAHSHTFTTGTTGGDQAHPNLPPYIVVYMWKRVA